MKMKTAVVSVFILCCATWCEISGSPRITRATGELTDIEQQLLKLAKNGGEGAIKSMLAKLNTDLKVDNLPTLNQATPEAPAAATKEERKPIGSSDKEDRKGAVVSEKASKQKDSKKSSNPAEVRGAVGSDDPKAQVDHDHEPRITHEERVSGDRNAPQAHHHAAQTDEIKAVQVKRAGETGAATNENDPKVKSFTKASDKLDPIAPEKPKEGERERESSHGTQDRDQQRSRETEREHEHEVPAVDVDKHGNAVEKQTAPGVETAAADPRKSKTSKAKEAKDGAAGPDTGKLVKSDEARDKPTKFTKRKRGSVSESHGNNSAIERAPMDQPGEAAPPVVKLKDNEEVAQATQAAKDSSKIPSSDGTPPREARNGDEQSHLPSADSSTERDNELAHHAKHDKENSSEAAPSQGHLQASAADGTEEHEARLSLMRSVDDLPHTERAERENDPSPHGDGHRSKQSEVKKEGPIEAPSTQVHLQVQPLIQPPVQQVTPTVEVQAQPPPISYQYGPSFGFSGFNGVTMN